MSTIRKWRLLLIAAALFLSPLVGRAQTTDGLITNKFLAASAGGGINLLNTGIAYHELTWHVVGSASGCTVALDSSADGITWSAGGAITGQTCTSNGNSSVVNVVANYVRINMTALTISAGGYVNVTWTGYVNSPGSSGVGGFNPNHITFGTYTNPCPSLLLNTTCFQGEFNLRYDVAATFSTSATSCGSGTVTAGHCVVTSSGASPMLCPGGTYPCDNSTPGCSSATQFCDIHAYGFGTYDCGSVNPNQCASAMAHGTILNIYDAHHANFSNAASHSSVGGTDTNFAWAKSASDDTGTIETAVAAMESTADSTKITTMDFPCAATFIDGWIVKSTSELAGLTFNFCGASGVFVPVPDQGSEVHGCAAFLGCYIQANPNSGQVLGRPLALTETFNNLLIWQLGLDAFSGDSAVGYPFAAIYTGADLASFNNCWVTGFAWNVAYAFPVYGWDLLGGTLTNSGGYVGGSFGAIINTGYFPVNTHGGMFGGGAWNGVVLNTLAGTEYNASIDSTYLEQGQDDVSAAQEAGLYIEGDGTGIANVSNSTIEQIYGVSGRVNLRGNAIHKVGQTAVSNAGATLNLLGGNAIANAGAAWLVQSNGTTHISTGDAVNVNSLTAASISGGTIIYDPQTVGSDVQAAKAAAQTAKTVYTVGTVTALFRVHLSVECTTTSAAATVTPSVLYTDTSNTVQTIAGSAATCTALGASSNTSQDVTFRAKTATNIQYQTVIANTPTYDVEVTVEQLSLN